MSTTQQIVSAIERDLAEAKASAREASSGHFEIEVLWAGFANKSELEKQRSVLRAIKPLMSGDAAPVHAVDRLVTKIP